MIKKKHTMKLCLKLCLADLCLCSTSLRVLGGPELLLPSEAPVEIEIYCICDLPSRLSLLVTLKSQFCFFVSGDLM